MNRNAKGFTLVELLVVIVILSLLVGWLTPNLFRQLRGAKVDIARAKMENIDSALSRFSLDCGRFPADSEELEALIVAPPDVEEKWDGPYLKRSEIIDVWENPYIYVEEGMINPGSYDLISFGADGVEGGDEGTENADIYND